MVPARQRRLLAASTALLLLTGCGTDGEPTDGAADDPGAAGGAQVDIVDNAFQPNEVEVAEGDTVEWENTGDVAHTVTFDDGDDSGTLDPGATHSRTFDEAGEYDYICTIHPSMEGTVTVTG